MFVPSVAVQDLSPDPPDPDPPDPHVFGPPVSGRDPDPYLYHQAKILRKTLIPTAL